MEQKIKCNHRLTLPLYARDQMKGIWTSTQKIKGKMVYICTKCGATLDKGFIVRDEEKLKNTESMSAGDALEKENEQ